MIIPIEAADSRQTLICVPVTRFLHLLLSEFTVRSTQFIGFLIGFLPIAAAAQQLPSSSTDGSAAQQPSSPTGGSKAAFSIFNPTPDDLLRSFATDRPTKSNSPYTVDGGRIQYETDLLNYSYSNYGGVRTTSFQAFDPVWKVGLTSNADLEFESNGLQSVSTYDAAKGNLLSRATGMGDFLTRLKINVFGDDGGVLAAALIPYVRAPSGLAGVSDAAWEGGISAPLRINITNDYGVIVMSEVDVLKNAESSNRHANFANLVNFSGPIPGLTALTGYIELYESAGTDRFTPPIYTFDTAVSYNITPSLQVDIGLNIGLNEAAPKVQIYAGLAQRS
jgi:hypothetical protein